MRVVLVKGELVQAPEPSSQLVILRINWGIKPSFFLKHFFRYEEAKMLLPQLNHNYKRFLSAVLLRLLSRRRCFFEDSDGHQEEVTFVKLGNFFIQFLRDSLGKFSVLHEIRSDICGLLKESEKVLPAQLSLQHSSVYLRTDSPTSKRAGGAIAHTVGVLNELHHSTGKPIFITTDIIPMVSDDVEVHCVTMENRYCDFTDVPSLNFNKILENEFSSILQGRKISFVYQRCCLNNFTGVKLSRILGVPFVLEYNGPPIARLKFLYPRLRYYSLSTSIEDLNLKASNVVVVVSKLLREDLVALGVDPDKILVNPNGVDPEKYSPDIDGSSIRHKYGLSDKIVIGYIGTFAAFHGIQFLAEAFGKLLEEVPPLKSKIRLLLVGDGDKKSKIREILASVSALDAAIFTGTVPQAEGPIHLAACDILTSPHVPISDGTNRFWGSPTKLFEYMGMGKAILTSELDQIGEILKHGYSAWMVKPGDVQSIMIGLKTLIENESLRKKLGEAARREVVAKYTWREHTKKIIDKLKERCDPAC